MPKRIQRKGTKGWKMPPGAVYVGRPTKYSSPYNTGDSEVDVRCYRKELEWYLSGNGVSDKAHQNALRGLRELQGKDLVCWCPLDQPCHADVLLELANKKL